MLDVWRSTLFNAFAACSFPMAGCRGGMNGTSTTGPGQSHTFSVFVGPITEDLGLSRQAMSLAYGLATLVAALLLPRVGGWSIDTVPGG